MTARFQLIGVVVADMARSLDFYRHLGLEFPPDADTQPHVGIALPGGLALAFDTIETIHSFDASWTPPSGGHDLAREVRLVDVARSRGGVGESNAVIREVDGGHHAQDALERLGAVPERVAATSLQVPRPLRDTPWNSTGAIKPVNS